MADVKFSELTSLAASDVASDDILAIVDTGASTSKKLTIDNLFGAVPVNIAQTDATDATSSAGAVRTAGGVSMAKKLYVGTTSTLVGDVTETAGVLTATQDGDALGSGTLQITSAASGGAKTLTLPNKTDTVGGRTTTDTLTNKTLTTPVIASLQQASGTNTLTMPAATDTLVGKATTDTLTNKTLTAPKIADAGFIADANGNEILQFETTTSAVNHIFVQNATTTNRAVLGSTEADVVIVFINDPAQNEEMLILDPIATAVNEITIQNSATGGNAAAATSTAPVISATGGDSNVDLGVLAKGTGHFTVRGTSIQGAIRLNCENNTHGQILQSQPHSAAQSNYVTLPSGTGSQGSPDFLMSRTSTDTMTNKTLTSAVLTTPTVTTSLQASTNDADVVLNQFDGNQVARIFDGGATPTTGFANIQTAKGGFGYRRRVISFTLADTSASVLTLADSGSMIEVIGSGTGYADLITLPAITAVDVGVFFDFVVTTVFHGSDSLKILTETAAAGGTQGFYLDAFRADGGSGDEHTVTAFSAGATDFLTLPASTPVGTTVHCEAVIGGSGTMWMVKSFTTGVAIAASST